MLVTMGVAEPYYLEGLIFAVPFISFGLITLSTVKGKLKTLASFVLTLILIIAFSGTSFFAFMHLLVDAATTTTTDIDKYERILKMKGYPDNFWVEHFPDKIPENAENIVFRYNPRFLQGGETFALKFKTDSGSIENYINKFYEKAKWTGTFSDNNPKANGIFSNTFDKLGYKELPEDFTIYVIYSEAYRPYNWNHGAFSLVAVSQQRNEIIFLEENW